MFKVFQFTQARHCLKAIRQLNRLANTSRFQNHPAASYSTLPSLNRVAVVTGAAKGIGRAIVLQLAQDGYDVALNDLPSSSASVEELCTTIRKNMGRKAVVLPGDVSVEEDVRQLVDGTVERLGGIDVMVANAGIGFPRLIMDTSVKDWDHVLDVNARGAFMCYKYAAQHMIRQGRGGRIIGASSIAGKKGMPYLCNYSASKFAVSSLTQTAAQEWAKFGITVNAYAPGPIETDLMKAAVALSSEDPNYKILDTGPSTALGFNGKPEDVAGLVSYLVSDQARFITGQIITIDGGVIFQ